MSHDFFNVPGTCALAAVRCRLASA